MSKIRQLEEQLRVEKKKHSDMQRRRIASRAHKLCNAFIEGECEYGDKCHYKHSEEEAVVQREKLRKMKEEEVIAKTEYDRITCLIGVTCDSGPILSEIRYSRTFGPDSFSTDPKIDIVECKTIISAIDDPIFLKQALEILSEKQAISLDDVFVSGHKFVFDQISKIKGVIAAYIRSKYSLEPLDYFKLWVSRLPQSPGRQWGAVTGHSIYIKGDMTHSVSLITTGDFLPRDDILIAAYVIGEICKVDRVSRTIYYHAN